MIPVEVTQTPWHFTDFWDWVDHWQTIIAGGLAFAAGFGTVVATKGQDIAQTSNISHSAISRL